MKHYQKPIVEKIEFDYTIQTASNSGCWERVTNKRTSYSECDVSSTPVYEDVDNET